MTDSNYSSIQDMEFRDQHTITRLLCNEADEVFYLAIDNF